MGVPPRLDEWGATEHTHTEIARWLSETHGFPGWWVQNVTVAHERAIRAGWLPDAEVRQRPTRAAHVARFDWADPPSRLVVSVTPKAPDKVVVNVGHEQLPDAESASRLKAAWRGWLGDLKTLLERD